MKKLLFVAAFALTAAACGEKGVETITVASRKATCYTVAEMQCFVIRREDGGRWEFWYDEIEGFDYTPGYEYVIKVRRVEREELLQDVGSHYYRLVDLVSVTEKESEDLPSIPAGGE